MTRDDLTPPQQAALDILHAASQKAERVELWWLRQVHIGEATRNVLAALENRGLALQRMEQGTFWWRITTKGRRLFSDGQSPQMNGIRR